MLDTKDSKANKVESQKITSDTSDNNVNTIIAMSYNDSINSHSHSQTHDDPPKKLNDDDIYDNMIFPS